MSDEVGSKRSQEKVVLVKGDREITLSVGAREGVGDFAGTVRCEQE